MSESDKKSKVAVIGFANIYLMPYIKKATAFMDDKGIDYDIIYWDRENVNDTVSNHYTYNEEIDSSLNVIYKLRSFFRYRKYVLSVLRQNNYGRIFVFYTIPAVLIKGYLKKNYKSNYIFAYSDYTFEANRLYKKWVADVVRNSYATTVSSVGFTKYLPKDCEYLVAHNCGNYKEVVDFKKVKKDKLNVNYAGMVRDLEHIKSQIKVFGNDDRFVLHFYGNGLCVDELREYIHKNDINNVLVHGRFEQSDKVKIMQEADIINNSLANDNFQKLAMTNRMYDAIFHSIPQIVTKGSYSDAIVNERGIGIAIDLDDSDCADKVYKWYKDVDLEALSGNCKKYVNEILLDMNKLTSTYEEYLKD